MDMIGITQGNSDLSAVISLANRPAQNTNYYQPYWQEWKNNAPRGGGEFRDIAVTRLLECLNHENRSLDLSNLGLSSLPEQLPPNIVSLTLSGNPLTHLPDSWPDALEQIYIDSQTLLQPHLEERLSAPEYRGPQIHFVDESEAAETSYPAFTPTDAQWLLVKGNGRQVRQATEHAVARNRLSETLCQPRTLLTATGILAGLALTSGVGSWLYNRWATPAQDDAHPGWGNDLALSSNDALPVMAPVAHALVGNGTELTQAPTVISLSEAEAIEQAVITFFRDENGSFATGKPRKEALIATIAAWLFPTGQPYEPDDKVIKLAREILSAAGRYGGKTHETLTAAQAKAVIRDWVFNTLLGTPLRDYIARKIVTDPYPSYFTLSSLKQLLSLPKLHAAGLLFANNVPSAMWGNLNAMWHTFLREAIPVLDDSQYKEAGTWSLSDFNFLALATGADYLADLGKIHQFNLTEITTIGASIWGKMTSEGASADLLPYLVTPALWYVAQTKPDVLQKLLDKQKPWAPTVVPQALDDWKKALQRADRIEKRFAAYQAALTAWSSKGQLADQIIARCPPGSMMVYRDDRHKPLNEQEEEWARIVREDAKERYLCCNTRPCNREDVPDSLSDEYKKITRNVADAYQKIDELLLNHALTAAEKEAADFISAADVSLHPAYLHMRTRRTPASGMGGMVYANDIFIETDNADLFSAKNQKEERIYALKQGKDSNSGYTLHRVDKDVNLYIKHGILSHKQLWKDYQQEGDKIVAGGYEFSFAVSVNPRTKLSLKNKKSNNQIDSYFSRQHGARFYDSLYQAGHDYSGTEKIWHSVKHLIPFYDCVEGIASGNSLQIAEALPSCMLDALAFIPVAGQAAALGGKYGMSLAQGIRRGVFKASQGASSAAIANSVLKGIALPTRAQVQSLLKTTLSAMDPGFEMLCKGSVMAGRLIADVSDARLAAKLKATVTAPDAPKVAQKTAYRSAKLPNNGPEVSVKKLENDLYVMVNPQTGEAFGNYYHLNKGKLSEVEVRYHLPEDPQPSGSRPKRPRTDSQPEQAQNQPPAIYKQLPPPADNVAYWDSVQIFSDLPLDLSLPKEINTSIQKLERFLPLQLAGKGTVKQATDGARGIIDSVLSPHLWRAWTGVEVTPAANIPPFITHMRLKLQESLVESSLAHIDVRNKLWNLEHHQRLIETDVGAYLSGILDTEEPEVLNQAFKRLMLIVENGDIFLNASKDVGYSNFVIFSTNQIPDPANPGKYISTLNIDELIGSPVAFVMIPDPEKRVYINADRHQNAYIGNNRVGESDNVNVAENSPDEGELYGNYEDMIEEVPAELNYESRLSDDLTHEITHVTSNTGDMFACYFPEKGYLHNGEDLLNAFIDSFDPRDESSTMPKLFEKKNFKDFVKQLRKAQGIAEELPYSAVIEAITTDPMLFANILMNDAETVATIIRDLAAGRTYDAKIRVRRDSDAKKTLLSEAVNKQAIMALIARQAINGIRSGA